VFLDVMPSSFSSLARSSNSAFLAIRVILSVVQTAYLASQH
jgi:ectoine hydroxylase-related dioxygenase (phytanoyl-CoA dioxygenase family)